MRLWFRRSRGRHALGAAVTALPAAPLAVEVTAAPPALPVEPLLTSPPAPAVQPLAAPLASAAPALPASRVQLGFRDGSTASLEPGSEQAVALEQLAGRLTRRTP